MKKLIALMACAVVLLCGCTKSTIVAPDEGAAPDFSTKENIEIDWDQAGVDAQDLFLDDNEYPYTLGIGFNLDPKTNEMLLSWVVSDNTPKEEIIAYAEELLRQFNNIVAVQDFSIAQSSETSYGGLWDRYGVRVSIAPDSTKEDPETWFVDNHFDAGQEIHITLNENANFQE